MVKEKFRRWWMAAEVGEPVKTKSVFAYVSDSTESHIFALKS
jgi:hypothetical protein